MAQDTTPMGSTTKLVTDPKKKSTCSCFPRLSTMLVVTSLAFSFGNILRLPRIVAMHGGGTFFVIYSLITIIFGIPLTFLEIVLGQFCQQGTTKIWRAVPLFKGVGFVKVLCSFFMAIYYPVLMVIALFYALWSIKGPIPFIECSSNDQISDALTPDNENASCLEKTFLKRLDQDPMWFGVNVTLLFLLWAFVMLCVSRGVKSYKLSVFFLVLPLIGCTIALLTQQLTIDSNGLYELFKLDWLLVMKFDTWYHAIIQFFFSTQIGFGNITTCSGNIYSKSNAFWTAVLYIMINLIIGATGVVLVYLWLGRIIVPLDDIAFISNNGNFTDIPLLFVMKVIYELAVTGYPNAQIWAAMAYFVLILSGFTSMVAFVYTIAVSIEVESKSKWRSWVITSLVCCFGFIAGVAIMLPEKLKFLHMLDYYVIGHMVAMSTALELIGFIWIYGIESIRNDFEFVLGYKLSKVWNSIWFTAPIFLIGIEIYSMFFLPLNGEVENTDDYWVYMTGWVFYGFLWFIIIIVAIWQIAAQVDYNFGQKLLSSLKPTRNWGPVDPMCRHGWVQWRDSYQATGERDFTLKRRGTRDYTHSIKSENRYSTMSLPRASSQSPYVVTLPDGLDLSENSYWRRDIKIQKKAMS